MSVLVVGLSHMSAPVTALERAAVSGDTLAKLLSDLADAEPVAETFVVSTCNRVEVYADVDRFHAAVTAICELLARHCGVPAQELTPCLYVHYEDQAVSHLLAVACGLDSLVAGDEQIVGQVRSALKLAGEHGTVGRVLGDLGRVALRAGKRARAETGIGRAAVSLLSLAAQLAAPSLGGSWGPVPSCLAGREVLVVGAGSMSALAIATASRDGAASVVVANRTTRRAERLAARSGVAATRVAGLGELPAALAAADVVICCTGAAGHVITADMVPAVRRGRLVFLDLAMPRDVEPAVADLPGVTVIGLDTMREHGTAAGADDIAAVRAIIEAELAAYRSAMDAARVAPTVVALRSKADLVVPAVRGGVVSRRELFRRLGEAARVTQIPAPAGSGKTVLLRSWIDEESLAERAAWVQARGVELDPQRFWISVADALRGTSAGSALVRPLTAAPDVDGWTIVERLLKDLASLEDQIWLVIDDVHELRSAEAQRQLELLVLRAPPELRLVLASRHDLRLGLHRLRLEGELTEIRPADLRFTLDEARALFREAGVELSDAALMLLHERTEGWTAGLRLAALSLAGHADQRRFAAEFSGSERTVAEYLLAEVLERQSEQVRQLLLRTSVLDQVNGPLADLLSGRSGGERVLQDLEEAGAFVVSLDARRSWFRYHPLFADLLRFELRRTAPEEVAGLHAAAAGWCARHGSPVEAVRHAQAAQDWAQGRGDLPAVVEEARQLLAPAEALPALGGTTPLQPPDAERAPRNPDAARLGLGEDLRALALVALGAAELWAPQAGEAQRHLEQGTALARRIGRPWLEVSGLAHWAMAARFGPFSLVVDRSMQAIELARRHGWTTEPITAIAYLALVAVRVWQGRLEEAEPLLDDAKRALPAEVEPTAGLVLHAARGGLELARGRDAVALAAFQAAEKLGKRLIAQHALAAQARAFRLRTLVRLGETERVEAAFAGMEQQERGTGQMRIALAVLRLAQHRPQAAIAALAPVVGGSVPVFQPVCLVEALLLEAIARDALDEPSAAGRPLEHALEQALELAEPDRVLFPFLLHPAPGLLERHARHSTRHAALISEILNLLAGASRSAPPPGKPARLREPISHSETRVLRYLPTNLSAPEIAAELTLSVNTVRTHLRHLYEKLGAHSRTEAVERARAIGLPAPS